VQERLRLYAKKVRKVWAEKELRESRRSLEVRGGGSAGLRLHALLPGGVGCPPQHTSQPQHAHVPGACLCRLLELSLLRCCTPPLMQINVGAVNRFISAAVPDLSSEQKAALKRAGQEGAAKRQGASAGAASAPGARGGGCCGGDGTQDAADAAEAFLRDTLGRDQGGAAPQQQQKKRRRS
jgi:hypothetical protein